MRKGKLFVPLALSLAMLTTACSDGGDSTSPSGSPGQSAGPTAATATPENVDIWAKYNETVTVTTPFQTNSQHKFREGDSYESNPHKTFLEQQFNIKIDPAWSAPAGETYNNRFNLMIASNQLPDVFILNTNAAMSAKVMLNRLVEHDMIEDLTKVYETYASDEVKDVHKSINDDALKDATYNGKLMALPSVTDTAGDTSLLWVRQDWLDELGLPAPKTLEDVVTVAKAFKAKGSNNLGLALFKDLIGGTFDASSVFFNLNSFPYYWLPDKDGNLVYGGIQPEVKDGLAFLADMFKQGLIEKEFPLKGGNELTPDLASGRAGMFFGRWTNAVWPMGDSWKNNLNTRWKAYVIQNKEGVSVQGSAYTTQQYLVVRKGYAHPELAVKVNNFRKRYASNGYSDNAELKAINQEFTEKKVTKDLFGLGFTIAYKDTVARTAKKFTDILAGTASKDILDSAELGIYENIEKDVARQKAGTPLTVEALYPHQVYTQYIEGINASSKVNVQWVNNKFVDITPTMNTKWAALKDTQLQAYYNIIMGTASMDSFDAFVKQWNNQGGAEITKEVNEAYQKLNQK
ncbi:MAG: hypothetical protein K0R57_376 [Paenibacillaceae bacterium]|nr:hypothetical protein [Paenibacillaceae bacterium]